MKQRLKPYWLALPDVVLYQIVTKPFIALWILLFGWISQALLRSAGRVAVTSGDFLFLFTSWQGYLILFTGLISLFLYISIDLNSKIALSGDLVLGRRVSVWEALNKGFVSVKALFSLRGIVVAFYIALLAPILGFGISISMTRGFHIPPFVSSVIADTPLYLVLTSLAALLLLSIGVANLFVFHGMVLDKMSVKEAGQQSRKLVRENWKDYLKQNLLFLAVMVVLLGLVALLVLVLPLQMIYSLPMGAGIRRMLTVFIVLFGCMASVLADLLFTPLYLMKMTQLFYSYKKGKRLGML